MKKSLFTIPALVLASSVSAATINVPGDQATIQDAINAASATGDEIVVASGIYTEFLELKGKSVTIRGASTTNRPIIVLNDGTETLTNASVQYGFGIEGDNISVTIKDIIFVPGSIDGVAGTKGIFSSAETQDADISITFENLLFSPRVGAGFPAITNPFDTSAFIAPTGSGSGSWPHDVLYIMSRSFGGAVDSNGTYVFDGVEVIGAGRDAFVCYSTGANSTGNGSITFTDSFSSRSARRAAQIGDSGSSTSTGDLNMVGTKQQPAFTSINDGDGITIFGGDEIALDYVVSLNSQGAGIEVAADNVTSLTTSHLLIVGSASDGFVYTNQVGSNAISHELTDSTFVNCGNAGNLTAALYPQNTLPAPTGYIVRDSIILGGGAQAAVSLDANAGALTEFQNCVFSPNPFTISVGDDAGIETNTNPTYATPNFNNTVINSIGKLETAYNVTAGGGVLIGGYGDFDSTVNDWLDF